MLYSMTGFGRAVKTVKNKKITVEAKSLNSKQLDLQMRMPLMFREVEIAMRDFTARKLERGKVDVNVFMETINVEDADDTYATVDLNVALLKAIKKQIETASEQLGISNPTEWYQIFTRFPEVMHSDKPAPVADDTLKNALQEAMAECLDNLLKFRAEEGRALESFFEQRIGNIRNLLETVEPYEIERVAKIKERIYDGLNKLSAVEHDSSRFEQEMIFYIEKLDVTEEKQRLRQHLDYFVDTLRLATPGQGKKLGFIAQEMGREINTLGSKSNHAEMQKIVVKMKDELEQIKEQVLNVM